MPRAPHLGRDLRLCILAGVVALLATAPAAAAAPRPNIVIIMTDDAGYSDLGSYGGEIPTPNIDALAAQGIRFTKFYTNARCSPTRASLMTGMYPHRVGVGALSGLNHDTPFPGYKRSMRKDVVTLAEALRQADYHTLMSGKWHLGGEAKEEADRRPRGRGFDRFFGILGGEHSYFNHRAYLLDDAPYTRGPREYGDSFYATRAITDHAVRFIYRARRKDRRPFFLYVPYTAPHTPHDVPRAAQDRYQHLYQHGNWETVRRARYEGLLRQGVADDTWAYKPMSAKLQERFNHRDWAIDQMTKIAIMSNLVDQEVGRIVDTIRDLGELEDTLIIYLSDNGPDAFHTQVGATPLAGHKHFLNEGGIATHCIVHWPAGIKRPGRIERQPGHVIDLMPTCLELAGVPGATPSYPGGGRAQRLDGRSLVPVLAGKRFTGHKTLFWELYGRQAVIHDGRWKYLRDQDGTPHLYDLQTDPTEAVDLATALPKKMARLAERYQRWAEANNVTPYDELEAWRETRRKNRETRRRTFPKKEKMSKGSLGGS